MSCPLLESFKGLPVPALNTLASSIINSDDIWMTTDEESGALNYTCLAERVYYAIGDKLLLQGEVNRMTRLHMEHALQQKGWLEEGENDQMTEWDLRKRLFLRTRAADMEAREQDGGMHAVDSASESELEASHHSASSDSTVG